MPTSFGGNFQAIATAIRAGKGHHEQVGDSQTTPSLDYLWWDAFPRAIGLDYHYFVASGANASQCMCNNLGFGGTASDCGSVRTDTKYTYSLTISSYGTDTAGVCPVTFSGNHAMTTGDSLTILTATGGTDISGTYTVTVTGATTITIVKVCGVAGSGGTAVANRTARIMGPVRIAHHTTTTADGTQFGSGILLPRQITATTAHSNAQRGSPWPCLPANSAAPWYHGRYMKAKLVYWVATTMNMDQFNVVCIRQGNSGSATTSSQVAHTNAASADRISSSAWTPAVADAGTYDVTANGIANDHEINIRAAGATGYDETNRTLIPLGAVFARCSASDGTLAAANADGTYTAYSAIGRGGAYVSDWLNFCTQQDWQDWFTATMLGSAPTLIDGYMLGHNLSPSGIDVGDGDGSQVEQSASLVTSYWKKRYKALCARRKAAFLAAFPSGTYIGPLIVIPWVSAGSSGLDISNTTRIASVNATAKEVAIESGGGWMSFVDYFASSSGSYQAPFKSLHPWTPEDGRKVAAAFVECLDRATDFRFTSQGSTRKTILFTEG